MASFGEEASLSPDHKSAVSAWVLNASSGLLLFLVASHCWLGTHAPNSFFCSYSVWLLLTFTFIIRCYSVLLQRSQRWFYINSLQITHAPHFSKAERGILIFDCINSIVFQMFLKEKWNVLERTDPSRRICKGLVLFFPCVWLKSCRFPPRRAQHLNTHGPY